MISNMQKLLLAGSEKQKESVLHALQKAGVVEVTPYKGKEYSVDGRKVSTKKAEEVRTALKLLEKYNTIVVKKEIQITEFNGDAQEVVKTIPELDRRYKELRDAQVVLKNRIDSLEPWGKFSLNELKEIEKAGLVIQFWDVAQKYAHFAKVENALAEFVVMADNERKYFVTFSKEPIKVLRCIEVDYDSDVIELEKELVELKKKENKVFGELLEISNAVEEVRKVYLTNLNEVDFNKVAAGTVSEFDNAMFILQAWCPVKDLETLKKALEIELVTIISVEPSDGENVPTLLESKTMTQELGSDLVNIYDNPSYSDWDPSSWVFFSFTIFFAMIMADGGYGLLLLGLIVYFKIKIKAPSPAIKRFLNLSMVLTGATFIYGLVSGSFLGIQYAEPAFEWLKPVTGFLNKLKMFDSSNATLMMLVSIIIGMVHISLSLVLKGVRSIVDDRDFITPIINIVWIAGIWSFFYWYKYDGVEGFEHVTANGMLGLKICGGALFVLYSVAAKTFNPFKMLFSSLFGLYNGVQFFSDILSYIRIFALGMSGALLAQTFNSLSFDLWQSGVAGMIFAPVIFLLGHILNIALCIMGGVIHGLRLNFLEWYRWSFDGGGKAFKPFKDLLGLYRSEN